MSNYPPGTSAGDPRAPWNDPECPKCPNCRERICSSGTMAKGEHADDCPSPFLDVVEIRERKEEQSHKTYDDIKERRIEEKMRKKKKEDSNSEDSL